MVSGYLDFIKRKGVFMKKLIFIALGIIFIYVNGFAQTDKIPEWMGNSVILLTKEFTGKAETINSFFNNPNEFTTVKVYASDNELKLCHEMKTEGIVILKVDVTFKLSKVLDGGTCYPYKLYYESPLTFESKTLSCRDPYSDSQSYGYLLGSLYEFIPMFYDKK